MLTGYDEELYTYSLSSSDNLIQNEKRSRTKGLHAYTYD